MHADISKADDPLKPALNWHMNMEDRIYKFTETNPVIFPETNYKNTRKPLYPALDKDLRVLSSSLDQFSWQHAIAGFCNKGIFVINNKRTQKEGFYFPAHLLEWSQISNISIKNKTNIYKSAITLLLSTLNILLFKSLFTGTNWPSLVLFLCIILLSLTILSFTGIKQLQLTVTSNNNRFFYISKVLEYHQTKRLISKLTDICPPELIRENIFPQNM